MKRLQNYFLVSARLTPNHDFKCMSFFDVKYLRNDTEYKHSCNGILRTTYAMLTAQ